MNNEIHVILSKMQLDLRRELERLNRAMVFFSNLMVDIEITVTSYVVTIQSLFTETPTSSPLSEEDGRGKRKHLVPTSYIITSLAKYYLFNVWEYDISVRINSCKRNMFSREARF